MGKRLLVAAALCAWGPLLAQSPVAPPAPSPIMIEADDKLGEQGRKAAALWKTGDAAQVAAAYAKLGYEIKSSGKRSVDEQLFLSDWIVALSYADPAAAQKKLDEWIAAKPSPPLDLLSAHRLVLQTRILILSNQSAAAQQKLEAAHKLWDDAMAALEAAATDKQRRKGSWRYSERYRELLATEYSLRLADLLVATQLRGPEALKEFATMATSPFSGTSHQLFMRGSGGIACAPNGIKEDDWVLLEMSYTRSDGKQHVRPLAQSRPEIIAPFLEDAWDLPNTFKGRLGDYERNGVLLRCSKAPPPATDSRPHIDYLRDALRPFNKEAGPDFRFNAFAQPLSDLVASDQWLRLLGYAINAEPLKPELQRNALQTLLTKFDAAKTPDTAAIDIIKFMLMGRPVAGEEWRLKALLPVQSAFVAQIGANPKLPPRVLAFMEMDLATLYEKALDPATAAEIYRSIVARSPATLPEKSPEVVKAQLRLASLADAGGDARKADMIIKQLGLSPDQCSIYQPTPTLVSFRSPDYPSGALRQETEGSVQFEFDLGTDGAATNFRVIASSPPLIFDERTIASFKRAKFAPATRGGKALPCESARQNFIWKMAD